MTEKELWQTMMLLMEIHAKSQERLAQVRAELAKLGDLEETKISSLDVSLY